MRAFVGENYVKQINGHTTQTLRRRKLLIILEYIFLSHFRAFYNFHFGIIKQIYLEHTIILIVKKYLNH